MSDSDSCRELRESALNKGLHSRESSVWRKHSRSCPDCRTELFMLDTLDHEASTQRQHIPRHEVDALFEAVRKRGEARSRRATLLNWSVSVLALAVICGLSARLYFVGKESRDLKAAARRSADAPAAEHAAPAFSSTPNETATAKTVSPEDSSSDHASEPSGTAELRSTAFLSEYRNRARQLRSLRSRVQSRRTDLQKMMNNEKNDLLSLYKD